MRCALQVLQEDGKEAELAYGPGFCGLVNLGNRCCILRFLSSCSQLRAMFAAATLRR